MKCKKCGNEFTEDFCPVCGWGSDIDSFTPKPNLLQQDKKTQDKVNVDWNKIIAIIIGIVFIIIFINSINNPSGISYASKDEMYAALQGVWVCKSDATGDALWAIELNQDTLTKYYYSDDEGNTYDIEYNPAKGYISSTSSTYVVKEVEDTTVLFEGEWKYYPGNLSMLERDPNSTSYKNDMEQAHNTAHKYLSMLKSKHDTISSVRLFEGGTCIGNRYEFDCTVQYKDGELKFGVITVYKYSSGEFEAEGLQFKY